MNYDFSNQRDTGIKLFLGHSPKVGRFRQQRIYIRCSERRKI